MKVTNDEQSLRLDSVDVLIVTALREEREAILHVLHPFHPRKTIPSPICYLCKLPTSDRQYKVAVTQLTQMGNVEAGIHITRAIAAVNPTIVLMVGIAAGVKGKVSLGDVIIARQVIYYEQRKETPRGPQPRPLATPVDPQLLSSTQNWVDNTWHASIDVTRPVGNRAVPRIHWGPLAVGDKVVADPNLVVQLQQLHSKIVGIEMESYGAALAAMKAPTRPRFLAIRGVSDYADEDKNDEWHEYAASAAATFAIAWLQSEPALTNNEARPVMSTQSESDGSLLLIRHLSMQYIAPETMIKALPPHFSTRNMSELLIDQTDLYREGRLTNPAKAVERQAHLQQYIDDHCRSYTHSTLAYFGIAHVPLLFHLGYQLTNKRCLSFFELNRYTGSWEHLESDAHGPPLLSCGLPSAINREVGDVILRISISDPIGLEDVSEIVPDPLASVHLYLEDPQRDVLASKGHLQAYGMQFRGILDRIHQRLPNRQCIHLFYAGPVSLAVYLGQLISPTIDRQIIVYNYIGDDQPRYSWGLDITSEMNPPVPARDASISAKES
jgi:nucleoside phosphorylase